MVMADPSDHGHGKKDNIEFELTLEPRTGTVSKIHTKPDPEPEGNLNQF